MDSKKILIVCRGFYPDISPRSFRATELAKELSAQGHDITVLTINRGDVYSELLFRHPQIKINSLPKLRLKNFDIAGSKYLSLLKRGVNRALMLLFEYPGFELSLKIAKAIRKKSGFDLLISIAMPHTVHWGVAKAWDKSGKIAKVWIADCGDPYMGEVTDSFRKAFYFKCVEKWFMRKVDLITIPIEAAKGAYYQEFHHKIRVVPQGYSFDNLVSHNDKIEKASPTFAYAGSFIPGVRDPREFIHYLNDKKEDFTFEIFTSQHQLIKELAEQSNGQIVIREMVPRDVLFNEFSHIDFLVNFDNNTNIHSPSKLIDYGISGLPILNITKNFDKKVVNSFLKGDYSARLIVADLEKYNIKNVSQQFLKIADEIQVRS